MSVFFVTHASHILFIFQHGTAFSFKKYCSSLVIAVKFLIFVRSDAEAPP